MKNQEPELGAALSAAHAARSRLDAAEATAPLPSSSGMPRNLSVNAYFRDLAERHVPRYRFGADTTDFARWQSGLLPAVRATLGRMPQPVPLNAHVQAEWREQGLIKQRVVLDVEEGLSAVAYVFRPDSTNGHRLPAILACHGHGPYGKESVMGNRATPEQVRDIETQNYDYGLRMAHAG